MRVFKSIEDRRSTRARTTLCVRPEGWCRRKKPSRTWPYIYIKFEWNFHSVNIGTVRTWCDGTCRPLWNPSAMFSCGVRTLFKVVSSSFFSHNGQVRSDAQGSGNPFCIQSVGASCKAMLKRGPSFVRKYFFEGLSGHKKRLAIKRGRRIDY